MDKRETIRKIFDQTRTIAVVGLSSKPDRPAHTVPAYLQQAGFHIIPVNPNLEEAMGEKAFPDLSSIGEPIDVVQIFRPPDEVPPVVDEAIAVGAKAIWMQLGISNEEAAEKARAAGLDVVMDACMKVEHRKLMEER